MKAWKLAAMVAAVLGCWSSAALAEETAKPARGPVVVPGIDILGKRQRPLATVDVAKLPVQVKLTELRQPFVERIAKAIEKSPF